MLGFGHGTCGQEGSARPMVRTRAAEPERTFRPLGKSPRLSRVIAMQQLLTIFATVFLAELGDKTQLATLLFAAKEQHHPIWVFAAAASALVTSTAAAVALGAAAEQHLSAVPLKLIAGLGFVAIGLWTIWCHFTAS